MPGLAKGRPAIEATGLNGGNQICEAPAAQDSTDGEASHQVGKTCARLADVAFVKEFAAESIGAALSDSTSSTRTSAKSKFSLSLFGFLFDLFTCCHSVRDT